MRKLLFSMVSLFSLTTVSCASISGENPYYYYVMCKYAYLNKDYKSAESLCEKTKELLPEDRKIYQELIKIYIREKNEKKLKEITKEYLKRFSDVQDFEFLANIYKNIRNPKKALEVLEEGLKKHPENSKLLLLKAEVLLTSGYLGRQTKELLKELLKKADKDPYLKKYKDNILYSLAKISIIEGDFERAEEYLLQTSQLKFKLLLSALYRQQGRLKEAQEILEKIAKERPKDIDILNQLFQIYVDTNQYEKAKKLIDKILSVNPSAKDALLKKFFLYLRLGKLDEFIQNMEKQEKNYKNNFQYYFILAMAYEEKQDFKKAVEYYEKAKQLNPDNLEVYQRLASSYLKLKQYKKAEETIKQAIKKDPSDYQLYLQLSEIYENQKNYRKAIQTLKKALEKFPDNPVIHYYIAILYDKLDDWKNAEKHLKEALKLRPTFHDVLNYLGYSYIIRNINIDEGIELVKKALSIKPDHPAYLDSLAWGYYKKGEYEKALQYIQKAYQQIKDDPVINYHFGKILEALGEKSKAKEFYEKALKLLSNYEEEPEKGITEEIKKSLQNLKW